MVNIAPHQPTIVTSLRADIVPHREAAIRRWYTASLLWQYHARACPGSYPGVSAGRRQADPDVRSLCDLLAQHDIPVTRSTQGHFYESDRFEEMWEEMEREESLIRSIGLPLRRHDDGSTVIFRAETFELPWCSFSQFHSQAALHEQQGYLGFLLARDRHHLVCRLHNQPYRTAQVQIRFDGELSCLLGGSFFGVRVNADDPAERQQLWCDVTAYLSDVLHDDRLASDHRLRFGTRPG